MNCGIFGRFPQQSPIVWKRWKWFVLTGVAAAFPALTGHAAPPAANGFRAGLAWEHLQRQDGGPGDGVGVFVGYRRALADDWDAWVQVSWAGMPRSGAPAVDLLATAAGVSLVLDASMFRPEIFAGIGFLGSVATNDIRPNGMALVGAALEIRLIPALWIGLRGEYRIPFLQRSRVVSSSSLGLHVQVPF